MRRSWGDSTYFTGYIDSLKIMGRAVTAEEASVLCTGDVTTHVYPWNDWFEGDTYYDYSGNAHHLTPYNSPTHETNAANCKFKSCIKLTGSSSGPYMQLPSHKFGLYPGLTFSFWFKDDGSPQDGRVIDFSNGNLVDTIRIVKPGNSGDDAIAFEVRRGTTNSQATVAGGWSTGVWHHFTWTLKRSSATLTSAEWRIFWNGQISQTVTKSWPVDEVKYNFIGKGYATDSPRFQGWLDTFRIFGRSVTNEEGAMLYRGEVTSAMYTFDQTVLSDTSGNLKHLTMTGSGTYALATDCKSGRYCSNVPNLRPRKR